MGWMMVGGDMGFVGGLVPGIGQKPNASFSISRGVDAQRAMAVAGRSRRSRVYMVGFPPPGGPPGGPPGPNGGMGVLVRILQAIGGGVRTLGTTNGQLFLFGFLFYLVVSGNFAWVFNTFFTFILVASLVPVVALLVLRFFVKQNLVEGKCANCGVPVAGLKNQKFNCSQCGVELISENGKDFSISDPANATLDVTFREEK